MIENTRKQRIKTIFFKTALIAAAGVAYGVVTGIIGFGIPCVINLFFGINCPGCGLSRFIINCLRFDFQRAIEYNYFAPVIVAFLIYEYVRYCISYIKNETTKITLLNQVVSIVVFVLAVVWTVVRNVKGI